MSLWKRRIDQKKIKEIKKEEGVIRDDVAEIQHSDTIF